MKNLHLLPTGKASRLFDDGMELYTGKLEYRKNHPVTNYNFYVTNDDEIKDCWVFNSQRNEVYFCKGWYGKQSISKKIILTTDVDLIKDGVQPIDDNELEWLVKNPNFEEVKVIKHLVWEEYKIIISKEERKKNFYCGDEVDYDEKCLEQCDGCNDATGVDYGYLPEEKPKYPIGGYAPGNYMCNCSTCKTQFQGDKRAVQCEPCAIKMTQEQQKQNIIDMMKGDEELGLYDEILPQQIWNKEKMEGIKQLIQDHKKETLEEGFIRSIVSIDYTEADFASFKLGAKWYQDKMCNSEVIQRIRASKSDAEARRIIRTI